MTKSNPKTCNDQKKLIQLDYCKENSYSYEFNVSDLCMEDVKTESSMLGKISS